MLGYVVGVIGNYHSERTFFFCQNRVEDYLYKSIDALKNQAIRKTRQRLLAST